ncbi:MAG: hypothetical protein GY863_25430 [bacterium]|nr:hypothetical protein [bacterium]
MLHRKTQTLFANYVILSIFFLIISSIPDHSAAQENPTVVKGPYLGQKPPGDEPEVFAAEEFIVSSHSAPAFSPVGNYVFWSSKRDFSKQGYEILYMKADNGIWSKPEYLCKGYNPFLSVNGENIYYVARGIMGARDIKTRKKTGTGWSGDDDMGSPFDSKKMMWNPSISANGTVYFCMFKDDYRNYEEYNIFRSEIINNKYSAPEKLCEEINGQGATSPYIAPDESYLIFGSSRSGGYGDEDLYISYQKSDGDWTDPVNLGKRINTSGFEDYPRVSPDGRYMFFLRRANIYWVNTDFIEKLKPEGIR